MSIRNIYVNPGDMIIVKIITTPDIPKNESEWRYQIRPFSFSFITESNKIIFNDPGLDIMMQTGGAKTRRMLK